MTRMNTFALACIAAAFGIAACGGDDGDTGTPDAAPTNVVDATPADTVDAAPAVPDAAPGVTPTYVTDILPIWNNGCGTPACHGGRSQILPLTNDETSYDRLVNIKATQSDLDLVEPNDVDASYLWHKLNNTHLAAPANGEGQQMPPGVLLGAADLEKVRAWIAGGAPRE